MGSLDKEALEQASPLAWVVLNNLITENQKPLEYENHRFLIEPMSDMSPDIVVRKSAQVGYSVLAILKCMWLARYLKMNVGYVLPTQNVVNDFVKPKVDPLIASNPTINQMVTSDSISIKQVGDRFIYYRGGFSERAAISISLDLLILDEYDRMPDMSIVNTYDSRLQASEFGWRWRFSNPSAVGFGVDELFSDSTQRHWFVTCSHCNHEWFMDWDQSEEKNHYVDREYRIYACGKCDREIYDADRQNGRWVAKYPNRERSGYWISQLMVPYVSAKRVVEQYDESSIEFFHNFVLGKAYTPTDLLVDRKAILRATAPSSISRTPVAIGVDNGIIKHYVIGTPEGIFDYGATESWDDIERLILTYNAVCVIDANPYPTIPKRLVDKYRGRVFINYYRQDTKDLGVIRWGENANKGVVYADRTKIFDAVAQEITETTLLFRQSPHKLEEYIQHWGNIYRTIEVDSKGIPKGIWVTKEGKPDHWAHATIYMRIAMTKLLGSKGMGTFVEASDLDSYSENVGDSVEQALAGQNEEEAWKYG